jgi:antitoxin (DNA-binding transcriptional repressor) of toxin-antitoxin stability system
MEIYTVYQFQERFDEMLDRVESGEHIGITDGTNTAVMIPADDELIRIYTDHEEGC